MENSASITSKDNSKARSDGGSPTLEESSTVRDVAGSGEGCAPEVVVQQMIALEVNNIPAHTEGEKKVIDELGPR